MQPLRAPRSAVVGQEGERLRIIFPAKSFPRISAGSRCLLTAAVAAGTGVFVLFKRNGLIRDFRQALEEGKERFSHEVGARLRKKLGLIYEEFRRSCASSPTRSNHPHPPHPPEEFRASLATRLEKARTEW